MLPAKRLLASLREFLPNIVVREVLVAREGIKVTRTGLRRPDARRLAKLAEENGFHVIVGSREDFPRRDTAKGGWCNSSHDSGTPGRGFFNVYVAADKNMASRAHDAESNGDDLAFGSALSTPACCQRFYDSVKDRAAQEQNDFFPFCAPVETSTRISALLNLGAQYFDASLISHFPCSLNCVDSIALAKEQARIMYKYDRVWLSQMLDLMNHGCVYTEYSGIYLLPSPALKKNGAVKYSAELVKGTSNGRIFRALASGDTAYLKDGKSFVVQRKNRLVASFKPTNLRLFVPEPASIREAVS